MEKIEEIMISYFKKEVQDIMEPWFEAVKDSEASFKNRSSAAAFLNLVKKRKNTESIFLWT